MNKKLMLLAAGALAALAFAALPAVASAGEYTADCESGTQCQAAITGGAAALGNTNGETVSCTSVVGTNTTTSGTSTGHIELTFRGCKETVTFFRFSCNNSALPSGELKTNRMTYHIVNLESAENKTPGVVITGANVTFNCAGAFLKTVTGDIVGHIENPNCGNFQSATNVVFEATQHGQQKYTQITTGGSIFDLISNNDTGTYLTSSQTGTGTLTAEGGNNVKITC
jgi:hypothetical protein